MIRALIVAHGDLATALVDAVAGLAGPQEGLQALSNRGCGMPEMVDRIRAAGDAMGGGPLFIFADLQGGSCAQAARMVVRDRPEWQVITGANVPMLVNFFQNRDQLPPALVLELMVDRARAGVQVFPGTGHGVDPRPAG
jgi:mannose/fructose-specific phosphotransferase system component IIA